MGRRGLIVFRVSAASVSRPQAFERALVLAETQVRRGGKVCFALSEHDSWAADILQARGLPNFPIHGLVGSEQDLAQLVAIASRGNAGAVLLCGTGFSSRYMRTLAETIPTAVDRPDAGFCPVQLVIDPSFEADESMSQYRSRATFFLGPAYQVVSPEVADWPRPRPGTRGTVLRCLIMSSDDHVVARLLDCMPVPEQTTTLTIPANKDCPVLNRAAHAACARGYLIEKVSRGAIEDTIAWCDAAIVTTDCHSTLLGFYSIPTLSFSVTDEHKREVQRLAEEGANLYSESLDEIRNGDIEGVVYDFFSDELGRENMGQRLGALVDGGGADRILDGIAAIHQPRLTLLEAA